MRWLKRDEKEATQVGGAILLRSFLNKDDENIYGRYYAQIFDLAVTYLQPLGGHTLTSDFVPLNPLRQALITVFKESFKCTRGEWKEQEPKSLTSDSSDYGRLGAIGIQLDQAYLVKAD